MISQFIKRTSLLKKKWLLFFIIFIGVFSFFFSIFFNNLQTQAASEEFYPVSDEITQVLRHLQYSYVDPEKLEGYKIMRSEKVH